MDLSLDFKLEKILELLSKDSNTLSSNYIAFLCAKYKSVNDAKKAYDNISNNTSVSPLTKKQLYYKYMKTLYECNTISSYEGRSTVLYDIRKRITNLKEDINTSSCIDHKNKKTIELNNCRKWYARVLKRLIVIDNNRND
jgi:hypothetical protein